VLKEVDSIICEDTRVTSKLLSHFSISKPLLSFRGAENEYKKIVAALEAGRHLALVSDAGTPGISDPGLELISRVREKFGDELTIEAIPGASALAAAISISGLRAASFVFYGFLPLKKGREKLLKEIATATRASVFYESPHRILKTLASLSQQVGSERRIGLFRELTKMHEEAIVGNAIDVEKRLVRDPQKQRGEFTIIVESK
jgi:16S rRNA (cytidine1402-2'-O)-methyltransferase